MSLVSPGVQVTIIDESQYIPSATNSVPYILLVTAQNKLSGSGVGIAAGTLKVNANKTYLITSQRDLTATYGNPFFYTTTTGTPINGYELNEYGLLAAYSSLGVSNRCYVQRADIDLGALTATLNRPVGQPPNGQYWFDISSNSQYGLYSWNIVTNSFTYVTPTIVNDTADLITGQTVPLESFGAIGDYAVVTTDLYNPLYYKTTRPTAAQIGYIAQLNYPLADSTFLSYNNRWVQVGSREWIASSPTIQGTTAPAPGSFTVGDSFTINGQAITIASGAQSLSDVVISINTLCDDTVAAAIGGKLALFYDSTATPARIEIANVTGTPLTLLGISPSTYGAPAYVASPSYQMPLWSSYQTTNAATGSIWQKTNNVNVGALTVIKKYNSTVATFIQQACPWYADDVAANYALDPSGGGQNIPVGSTYTQYDPYGNSTGAFQIFQRYAQGPTIITGVGVPGAFTNSAQFTIQATQAGSNTLTPLAVATLPATGTLSAVDFVAAFSAVAPNIVNATINSAGQIVITHIEGGTIYLGDTNGTPLETAGITTAAIGVTQYNVTSSGDYVLSNWVTAPTFTYIAQANTPSTDPVNGTLWYYSDPTQVDIMIQDGGAWVGYQNDVNDTRGYNLSQTNTTGPIISATSPTVQTDNSPLEPGDLWVDTSDLENFPTIYRWQSMNGMFQWVQIDNTDQTTSNGILFADARWAPNGDTDPITDPIPTIQSLLTSDYLDLDAPNPLLYPQGILLFNTRRSGFNVKSYQSNYFNAQNFPDSSLPTVASTWLTASGNRPNGSAYMGRQAQRAMIVQALKSGIDTSVTAREETLDFNLIACPQYPELAPNLVALNNERSNTAFTLIDTPLRLTPAEIVDWATNNNGLGLPTADGLLVGEPYSGAWYPSCTTTD